MGPLKRHAQSTLPTRTLNNQYPKAIARQHRPHVHRDFRLELGPPPPPCPSLWASKWPNPPERTPQTDDGPHDGLRLPDLGAAAGHLRHSQHRERPKKNRMRGCGVSGLQAKPLFINILHLLKNILFIFPCWLQRESITTGNVFFVQRAKANGRYGGVPGFSGDCSLLEGDTPL